MRSRISVILALLALLAMGAFVAGCDDDDDGGGETTTAAEKTATPGLDDIQVDEQIAAAVPADIKSKGTLTVAADATYAPDEYIASDGKTMIGMDPDLAKAIGKLMGLEVELQNITFDSIIPGIDAGKYDLGMSSFTDTKEREQIVDFVTYLTAGTAIYANADGDFKPDSLDALCGHTVSAERGTTQQDDIESQDKKCTAEGKPGVTGVILPDQNQVNLALSSGRAEAAMADSPVAAYAADQSEGQFEVTGGPFPPEPYGIAIPKDSGLAQPVLDAVKALMADGTYDKILEYWNLQDGAIDNPVINGAVS